MANDTEPVEKRLLWRLQGPTRIVTAGLAKEDGQWELHIWFEPESAGDLLCHHVEDAHYLGRRRLERRAARVRTALREQGWIPLGADGQPLPPEPRRGWTGIALLGGAVGLFAAARWASRHGAVDGAGAAPNGADGRALDPPHAPSSSAASSATAGEPGPSFPSAFRPAP